MSARRLLTQEQEEYLIKISNGNQYCKRAELLNDKFGTSFTDKQIRNYCRNHKINSDVLIKSFNHKKLLTEEQEKFIVDNIHGISTFELTDKLNNEFGTSFSRNQIRLWIKNRKLKSGYVSKNHGMKGKKMKEMFKTEEARKRWESTTFKKGNIPHNSMKIGDERIINGRVWVKVDDKKHSRMVDNWKPVSHIMYENYHGKEIPKGYKVNFADGDVNNYSNDNLVVLNNYEQMQINKLVPNRNSEYKEIFKLYSAILKVKGRLKEIER